MAGKSQDTLGNKSNTWKKKAPKTDVAAKLRSPKGLRNMAMLRATLLRSHHLRPQVGQELQDPQGVVLLGFTRGKLAAEPSVLAVLYHWIPSSKSRKIDVSTNVIEIHGNTIIYCKQYKNGVAMLNFTISYSYYFVLDYAILFYILYRILYTCPFLVGLPSFMFWDIHSRFQLSTWMKIRITSIFSLVSAQTA